MVAVVVIVVQRRNERRRKAVAVFCYGVEGVCWLLVEGEFVEKAFCLYSSREKEAGKEKDKEGRSREKGREMGTNSEEGGELW
jgi:hypothetical protein